MLSRILLTRYSRAAAGALASSNAGMTSSIRRHRRMLVCGENEHRPPLYRFFHRSSILLEEEQEPSAKEKKKLLKEKAKAAMAEKEKAEEAAAADDSKSESSADAKKSDDEGSSSSSSSDSSSSSGDPPPPKEKSGDPPPKEKEASTEKTPTQTTATTEAIKEYSYPELTRDAAQHKAGLDDPTRPEYQNPLHHLNPDDRTFEEDFESKEEFEKAILPAPPLADANGKVPAPEHIQQLADEMVNLTMLEYNELINKVADHYGFSEDDLAPSDDVDGGDDDDDEGDAPAAEAKTKFDVKLVSFDSGAKIKIIKEIRAIVAGLGLKEAKALVESAPVTLQKEMSAEAAEEVKAKLEALGAKVQVE